MREIKFRAYIPQMKRVCLRGKGLTLNKIRKLDESYFRDDVVWVEFTGLHDKNGKEIYEGDIVKAVPPMVEGNWHIYKIYWCERAVAFCFWQLDTKNPIPLLFDNWAKYTDGDLCRVEVIGNIYENPELLIFLAILKENPELLS